MLQKIIIQIQIKMLLSKRALKTKFNDTRTQRSCLVFQKLSHFKEPIFVTDFNENQKLLLIPRRPTRRIIVLRLGRKLKLIFSKLILTENKPKSHCTVDMVFNSENTGTSLQFFKIVKYSQYCIAKSSVNCKATSSTNK